MSLAANLGDVLTHDYDKVITISTLVIFFGKILRILRLSE